MRKTAIYWLAILIVFVLGLLALGDVLLPFVIGGAVAYFLDPVADRLERLGLKRLWAVSIISLLAVLFLVVAILLVIPTLVSQGIQLVNTLPKLVTEFRGFIVENFPDIVDEQSTVRTTLDQIASAIQAKGGAMISSVLSGAMSFVSVAIVMVVAPVVAFYLLLDWDRMVARVDDLLPRYRLTEIRTIMADIDRTLSAFIRGQALVCVTLGLYYAITLALVGLNFGLVVGFIAGMISFIPYVGALVGGALAIGLALFQFWGEWFWIAAVVVIFLIGQFLEGNILTPNLVGNSVGLHPVWLIFALAVFGSLFGFLGMLIAVPLAAMIGVVTRYALVKYREGPLYLGPKDDRT